MFQIWIDTGGTFTDCIAMNPKGEVLRSKVLSSSFLRGNIMQKKASKQFYFEANWNFDAQIVVGFSFRLVGQESYCKILKIDKKVIELDHDLDFVFPTEFEITSHEEAPILATRIVTQTQLNQRFPKISMRLGTTKGTNALLEKKGAKVALLVTKGFKDLLKIGTQQRPNLFQIAIPEPTLLYDFVFEVNERMNANGEIIEKLTRKELNQIIEKVQNSGCESVAVSFMHSYLNNYNEKYFNLLDTSLGSTLSSNIGYLKRTQTALVNAYLQPILTEYLENITQSLGGQHLMVMTSAGGLIKAENFNAKDSLLSGPAGGMVGAAKIAQRLGFERCLTFDMGGTSTDTARFDGRFDLQFVSKINEIELHNPTLAIETVAAGGGSICSFDGHKLKVGPESAGANPGPASYGAGGPLTITDVNLLLNKLETSFFGIPIRVEKAQDALLEIQEEIRNKTGVTIAENELLKGFEQIANEKMAEAIRRISVSKGFDPKDYPLLTFGGAGGLHGCQLAEILGIKTIILPYDAGLLSAFGMGNALAERISTCQVLKSINEVLDEIPNLIDSLIIQAKNLLKLDDIYETQVRDILLYLRFKGQENALELSYTENINVDSEFKKHYKSLFGHCPENLSIELESIKVIVTEKEVLESKIPTNFFEETKLNSITQKSENLQPAIYQWDTLQSFDTFVGPAVILNTTSTSYIPANWQAIVTDIKDIVVKKIENEINNEIHTESNELIELELFTNRFMAIAEEMGAQLQRTAFSVNVKERLDFSCALLDSNAELLVNAPHIPVHLGSLGVCARLVLEKISINPGDVIIINHPKYGGSHLPDVTLISVIFTEQNQLIGYAINRAHHAEIGGKTPGSMPPDATSLIEEGVVILPTYLVKNGELQWEEIKELFSNAKYPTRALTENIADINAALASLKTGELALQKLVKEHGLSKVHHYMKLLKNAAFDAIQFALKPYIQQDLEASEKMDDGREINVKIYKNDVEKLVFDFNGTSDCHPNNLNANISIIYSAILYVLRLLVNKNIPLNEGLIRNVEVVLPDNSFLHPNFTDDAQQCPAVVGGNTEVSQRLVDTLLKAFGIAACSQGTMNNFLFGNEKFGYYETICGGTGASEGHHGRSAVHQHMTNTRITDPEELERRYPVRLQQFALRQNSGGKGKWNGGDGIVREIKFLDDLKLTLISQHRITPPYGINGGENGKCGQQTLLLKDGEIQQKNGIFSTNVVAGDSIIIETPGGGGWGKVDV